MNALSVLIIKSMNYMKGHKTAYADIYRTRGTPEVRQSKEIDYLVCDKNPNTELLQMSAPNFYELDQCVWTLIYPTNVSNT